MDTIIKVKGLTKTYADIKVLNNATLSVEKGETLAITGENGSGKSTLLQLISGLLLPSDGTVEKMGYDIRIGYVPEQFPTSIRFTASEYLFHLGRIEGYSRDYLQKRIKELLVQFRLSQPEELKIKKFSKGMKQKVGIMQALLSEPDILILDEPLSGLDPESQEDLESILYGLKSDKLSMLLSCHDKKLLERVVDRVIVLQKGHIVDDYSIPDPPTQGYVKIETAIQHMDIDFINKLDGIVEKKYDGNILISYVKPSESDQIIAGFIEKGLSIKSVNMDDELN